MANDDVPTITILQADGIYEDDSFEKNLFAPRPGQNYKLNYVSGGLFPTGAPKPKPWSAIPEEIRNQVDGIEVLKMGFTRQDLELFPKLKV